MREGIPQEVVKDTVGFVDDLRYATGKKLRISAEFDRICICGMGGSAIGGDIMSDVLAQSYEKPVTVIRALEMPNWADSRTLVIACSYSGNTRETLLMYDQAHERGCPTVVITAGGELRERARRNGDYLIGLRPGVQPRSALGLILGYIANIIETVGGPKCKRDIKKIIPKLYRLRNSIGFKNPDSYAKKMAQRIHGTVPAIYATAGITASAVRWKTQINENSKMLAFNGVMPEFNHNEVSGWSESSMKFNCLPVFLLEEDSDGMMRSSANASLETMRSFGVEPLVLTIRGDTIMERSLRAIMFGDYISLYLAFMNDVDPIDVGSITSLKERVAKRLGIQKRHHTADRD